MRLKRQSGECLDGFTVDISASGLAVTVPDNLPTGETVAIAFTLIKGDIHQPVQLTARVVYSVCCGMDGFRLGMQILQCSEASRQALAAILPGGAGQAS